MPAVFFNGPEQYDAPGPIDTGYVVGPVAMRPSPQERDGLFFRADLTLDPNALAQTLQDGNGTVQQYQHWAETGWKTAHGTYGTVRRFGQKLNEERAELQQAATEYRREPSEANRLEVIRELGDNLLCLTILSCNGSASIDAGLKFHLYQYVQGVLWMGNDGQPQEPVWRPSAAALATKFGPITLSEVDKLIEDGFVPLPSPVMNIYDPEDNEDGPELSYWANWLQADFGVLYSLAERQYAWGGGKDTDEVRYTMLPDGFREAAFNIGQIAAKFYLEAAYIARHDLGDSLQTVISENIAKVMPRIARRRIDKSDGPRDH